MTDNGRLDWYDRLEKAAINPDNPLPNDTVIVRRADLRRAIDALDNRASRGDQQRIADGGET